jgi:hypothetical protein
MKDWKTFQDFFREHKRDLNVGAFDV